MSLPSPRRRRAVSMLSMFPWALLLFQFLLVLPRYEKLFREHSLKLPDHLLVLIGVSAWVLRNVMPAFSITFLLMGVSLAAAHVVQSRDMPRGRRMAWLSLIFGIPSAMFVFTWVGVLQAHRTLIEGLQR